MFVTCLKDFGGLKNILFSHVRDFFFFLSKLRFGKTVEPKFCQLGFCFDARRKHHSKACVR